jgi:hypothetical protein
VQQQQAGCVAEYLTRAFGELWFTHGWFQVKFIAPLNVFDPIDITAKIIGVTPGAEGAKVELELWVRRASDSRFNVVGWASCLTPKGASSRTKSVSR